MHTGDVGYLDETGSLIITDRIKDVIKSGGEWISSLQIENIVLKCKDVKEAAAIGIEDKKWGERPIIIVSTTDNENNLDTEKIIKQNIKIQIDKGFLSKWAMPDKIEFVSDIEKTSVGKVNKINVNYGNTNQSLSIMSSDFWKDKIGIIARPSFFEPTPVKKIGLIKELNKKLTLSLYSQYDTFSGIKMNGTGLGLKWSKHQGTSISANISKVKSNINLTAGSKVATQLTTVDLVALNLKEKLLMSYWHL